MSSHDSGLIDRAAAFAKTAHESIDQRRKYTNEPYIVHPQAVASTVASVTDDEAMIAAAWLHDVVEDTPITIDMIRDEFRDDVANLVDDLTDVALKTDGNRKARLAIDREHTANASVRAKTIKLADLIDNLSDIVNQNPGFAVKYVAEKELLLTVLRDGDASLFARVEQVIEDCKRQLAKQ